MLGLRISPLARRTPSSTAPTTTVPNDLTDDEKSPSMAPSPAATGGNHVESELSHLTVAHKPLNGQLNSHSNSVTNEIADRSESHFKTLATRNETRTNTTDTKSETRTHVTKEQQVTILKETVISTRGKFIAEFDHVDGHYIDNMTFHGFLNYIERERLTHMPHRGSRWDKVLKWAEFFALQISGYYKAVESFVPDSKEAAKLIWAASRVLLELGPDNSQALETTFGVFYKVGLSLAFFLRHNELLYVNGHIRMEVGHAFVALLMLVREVTIYYQVRISDISSNAVSLDFNATFDRHLNDFYRRKNHITDAMWEYKLGSDVPIDISSIRKWLVPNDRIVRTLLDDDLAVRARRDEYTCEWFQRSLLDFSRGGDDLLAISGPAGCGKSFLSGWIIERLQRPLGRKTCGTISYSIESDIPSATTSQAIARNLALQLLESNVGDVALFNALEKAHEISVESKDNAKLEDALWRALDIGLDSVKVESANMMIVVDGLDDAHGGEQTAKSIRNHLQNLASKHENVQAIVLSRDTVPTSHKGKIQRLEITRDHTRHDICHMADHALQHFTHFRDQDEFEREAIVEQVADAAKGNFLWVVLTAELLKRETTHEGFMKAVKAMREAPRSLVETIQKHADSLDFSKSTTDLLFSWLLVAERPLTINEIKCLLEVDPKTGGITERKGPIKNEVRNSCGFLVVFQDGVARFRHSAIRSHLLKIQTEGKKLPNRNAAQTDLTTRILAYCKSRLTNASEPGFEHIEIRDVDELFQKHALLEYAVRNWIFHFRGSSMHKTSGAFQFSADFKSIFPTSTQLPLLEWTCWERQVSAYDALRMHDLALRVREGVFTENHQLLLQTLIICGNIYRKLLDVTEAATCFYRASRIGQSILRKYSNITFTCTATFLTITENITVTTRTEVVSRKEEMLKYMIVASEHQHGKTSDVVIRYRKTLAQLYVDIHEEHKAEVIWRELREIIVGRHGKGSEEEKGISKQLTIVLKKGSNKEELIEYEKDIFETSQKMEVWDVRRIKITLDLALSYEARGELFLAEELYVVLWGRLTEHCHNSHHTVGVEIHIPMIDVALEYVRFLRRFHRHEEASNILICIWTEYEEYDFESETIFLRLKVIGELMRAISLLSIAVSVFRKCWGWFKAHGKHEHMASCEILISETVQEIVTTTTKSMTTISTTTTTTTETVIKEVFESTISRTTVTSETISVCKGLISYYMELKQWSAAIEVTRKSLSLIWKMVLTGGGTCALPREFGSGAIDIAIDLAVCYHRSEHFHEAEEIYLRIYRACRNSCQIQDERLIKAYRILIELYEEHRHWHKIISIYQEMLIEYRRHLGPSHALTIKTLYILGSLCSEHGHGDTYEYYEEIITVLNRGSHVCHHDAMDAMIVLCRMHYEDGHWDKLHGICKTLWETWTHHHHEHKFEAEFIEVLYIRYRYLLEHNIHCEYEDLRTITIEYRDICIKAFGASSAITIKALIELAEICMRSQKYMHEAISTYEEVLTKTTTTTTMTTTTTTTSVISSTKITDVKKRLSEAYVVVCGHNSTSTITIERAIQVLVERFEYLKITLGCASLETLKALRELVLLYKRVKSQETHTVVVRMLNNTSIEIITKEKHSRALYDAAKIMAEIYISHDLREDGLKILREIRGQIITGTGTPGNKLGFKLDKSVGKVAFVFLVAFEETSSGSVTISYSQIMADLLTETTLYESYKRCFKSKTSVKVILSHGARLRDFLESHGRSEQVVILENELLEIFLKEWGSSIKTRRDITKIFHIRLLTNLAVERHDLHIGQAACMAGNAAVQDLLEQSKFQEAYEVALCAFQFISHLRAYHHMQNVGYGFKLSAYLALRGLKKPVQTINPALRDQMLKLSREVIRDVLQACKESKINFVRLRLEELNELVGLLGAQQNYGELEMLLKALWSSREAHKKWKSETIVAIGKRLVQARFLGGHGPDAIPLCEDICYNLRRVWGSLHPNTLEMSELLSQVYMAAGHYREAMGVHEEILLLVVEGDDDDDRTIDTVTPETAAKHLKLLESSYQHLGGWDKSPSFYKDLVSRLLSMKEFKGSDSFKGLQLTEKWNVKEKSESVGRFVAPEEWSLGRAKSRSETGEASGKVMGMGAGMKKKRPGYGAKRVSSNWGMGFIHRVLHGSDEEEEEGIEEEEGTYSMGGYLL